jgi:hypothetical protein
MRNFKMLFFLFGLMVITTPIFSSPKVEEARVCIRQYYDSQTYVKELTNRNDGVEITGYFHKIGIFSLDNANSAHRAWCGAFQANAWLNCNVPVPFTRYLSRLASVDTWNKATAYQIPFRKADTGDVVSLSLGTSKGYMNDILTLVFPTLNPVVAIPVLQKEKETKKAYGLKLD